MTFIPLSQVFSTLSIAQSHIRPLIHQLPYPVRFPDFPPVHIHKRKFPARYSDPHTPVLFQRPLIRQIRHPGRSLRLPVHHIEPLPMLYGILRKPPVKLRLQLSSRLSHGPKRRKLHSKKPQLLQHLISIRNPSKRSSPLPLKKCPEILLHQSLVRQQNLRSHQQMTVDNRQTICIIHWKSRNGPFPLIQLQILPNGPGIGQHIPIALPH